jgi:hypothetical protein
MPAAIHMPEARRQARFQLGRPGMNIEDVLAPGRIMESLARRAARGHKPAQKMLLEFVPALCDAEDRYLYPELLKHRAPGAQHAWLLPFGGEHEQMLHLIEQIGEAPAMRNDPMLRALQWLVLRHVRAEREWLQDALGGEPLPDDAKLGRFVEQIRPLLARARQAMEAPPSGERLTGGATPAAAAA